MTPPPTKSISPNSLSASKTASAADAQAVREGSSSQMDVYSGVRWSAVATYGCQAVQFVTTMVLARLLVPEYFGLLAMAQVFVGFAGTFSTMGFSQAIVQREKITKELLRQPFRRDVGRRLAFAPATPGFRWKPSVHWHCKPQ